MACRILSRAGIGVDNIDLAAAKEKNIPVTNVPDYCIGEVSDHAMALILSFARKLPEGTGVVAGGGWGIVPPPPLRLNPDSASHWLACLVGCPPTLFKRLLICLGDHCTRNHRVPSVGLADSRQSPACGPSVQAQAARCHLLWP